MKIKKQQENKQFSSFFDVDIRDDDEKGEGALSEKELMQIERKADQLLGERLSVKVRVWRLFKRFCFSRWVVFLFIYGYLSYQFQSSGIVFGLFLSISAILVPFMMPKQEKEKKRKGWGYIKEKDDETTVSLESRAHRQDALEKRSLKNDIEKIEEVKYQNEEEPFEHFYVNLRKIAVLMDELPEDLLSPTKKIGRKTLAIIRCMEQDPRDIPAGSHFLQRYLPMICQSLESFTGLLKHKVNIEEFNKTKELTQQVLDNMAKAFAQTYRQLLDNDVDDLVVTLKTMDRLRKSEGFDEF